MSEACEGTIHFLARCSQDAVTKNKLLAYYEFGADTFHKTGCIGTEHNGKDWIITKDKTIVSGVHCNVRNFIVKAGKFAGKFGCFSSARYRYNSSF